MESVAWVRAAMLREVVWLLDAPAGDCPSLAAEPDWDLALAAIECLADATPPGAAGLLAEQAVAGDPALRRAAIRALRSGPLSPDEETSAAREILERAWRRGAERWFLADALCGLEAAGSPLAGPAALDLLWDDDAEVVAAAIAVVARHPTPEARTALQDRAGDGPERVRALATQALRDIWKTRESSRPCFR